MKEDTKANKVDYLQSQIKHLRERVDFYYKARMTYSGYKDTADNFLLKARRFEAYINRLQTHLDELEK